MTSLTCTANDPTGLLGNYGNYGDTSWLFAQTPPPPPPPPEPPTPPAAQDPERNPLPQTAGQGVVTSYDTWRRTQYLSTIKENSSAAVSGIDRAQAAGNLTQAETVAREASDARNLTRAQTQGRLTPGGRVMSGVLEQDRTWATIVQKYSQGAEPTFDTWRSVASATGRSSRDMVNFTRVSKFLGPAAVIFGAGVAAYEVSQAPPAQRAQVAAREGGGVLGGAIGGSLGVAAGAVAVTLLVSNPVGWMVIGAGIIGAGLFGWGGSELGRGAGTAIYNAATQ